MNDASSLQTRRRMRRIRSRQRRHVCAVRWDEGWVELCRLDSIEPTSSRTFRTHAGPLALFRTQRDEVIAVADQQTIRGQRLSEGSLEGRAVRLPDSFVRLDGPDVVRYEARLAAGRVMVRLVETTL